MKLRIVSVLALAAPLLGACGGGGGGDGPVTEVRLCPASLDYTTVFTGGGASGELVKLQLDTTKMTWQVNYVQSPIPAAVGTVSPTRAGQTASGTLTQETLLPTNKLNQCAYRLNGASLDASRPARIFVGEGVAGGTIPGAEISFGGILGVGAVPDTTFPYYPFIGFSSVETNIANVKGTYNQVGYHLIPSQSFAPVKVDSTITINADGSYSECDNSGVNAGKCQQPGTNFVNATDTSGATVSAFETDKFLGQGTPTLATTPKGRGYMIVGKLKGQLVPILVRAGAANASITTPVNGEIGPYADDESGISILAPQATIASGSQNGEYIGVDSQFDYRTTALEGAQATLLDPFNASQASLATALNLDYTQTVPGVVTTTQVGASTGTTPTGKMIFSGGVFGYLDITNAASPYFSIGAFVQ
ncbi:DUF2957 domain-containing protein [Paraburkholderia sp. BCC1886]|uniref:DUF2957 domain-containing protein n=1 Tax=Paraburkholderia sp. BCC1886 TaxID=2562670 RepID=UPI001183696E|nr:DUF2957 domain-containing protein [Paraburkholderia sp. BCC1886]